MSKELKITPERIKKIHDGLSGCSEAQDAIRDAFPEAFEEKKPKEEWVNITRELEIRQSNDYPQSFYFQRGNGLLLFWGDIKIIKTATEIDIKIEDGHIYMKKKY